MSHSVKGTAQKISAIYNKSVEQVMQFKYFGVNIKSSRDLKKEVPDITFKKITETTTNPVVLKLEFRVTIETMMLMKNGI